MKTLFLTIAVLVISGFNNIVTAQSPDWLWAKSAGGTNFEAGRSVSTDTNGNVFMTGEFGSPTITFGTTTLTNSGDFDIYIVKYDAGGNVLWARSAGGTSGDFGYSVSTDVAGNVFLTGTFLSPTITFGTTTLTNISLYVDIFIVKYDSNGNLLWAKSEGGTGGEVANSAYTDAGGNLLITGSFWSPTISFGTTTLTNAGSNDIFVVKYDSGGNVLWAKSAGGNSNDNSTGVSTDTNGNVFIAGGFDSPSITFGTSTLSNAGLNDLFIVKYDSIGNVLWAKSEGGSNVDYGSCVSADASGNIFMTGLFYSSTITFDTISLTNAGYADIFIVKYDSGGNVLWAKNTGSTGLNEVSGISTDAGGNLNTTGWFESPDITFGTTTLNNAGLRNIFIVKFDAGGNVLWAKSAGGAGQDFGCNVASDATGNVFMSGVFNSSVINFGVTTLTLTNAGFGDVFIAKLDTTITTGISEHSANSMLVIAPNPFTLQTKISFKGDQKNTIIKIMDVLGKEIKSLNFNGNHLILEKGEMPAGIYFVQVIDENNNVASRKIVIQ